MANVTQLDATIAFVNFMTMLMDLKLFNTILVLHDGSTKNRINLLIENFDHRYDITWRLVNEYDNAAEYWNQTTFQDRNELILTAVQTESIFPLLYPLYYNQNLNIFSRNLVIFSGDKLEFAEKILSTFIRWQINAILVDWTGRDVLIYAWNPFNERNFVELNATEFLEAGQAAAKTGAKYTGLFYDQLQSMEGKTTRVLTVYDEKNMYNVVTTEDESAASIDGLEIQLLDVICEAIQSPMDLWVLQTSSYDNSIDPKLFSEFLERKYRTYAPTKKRTFEMFAPNDYSNR